MVGSNLYEPDVVYAGDTVTWTRSYSNYPASAGWVLSYALVKDGNQITFSSSASGDSHLVSVAAATTTNWTAGEYYWQAYVTKASERYNVGQGKITIRPNFAAQSSGYDARSHAQKVLDALEATLENKASKDQMAYAIRGRSISRMNPEELVKWIDFYRKEVAREKSEEKLRQGLNSGRKVTYRIVN